MLKQRAAAKAAREERLEGGVVVEGGGEREGAEGGRVKVDWSPAPRVGSVGKGRKRGVGGGSGGGAAAVVFQVGKVFVWVGGLVAWVVARTAYTDHSHRTTPVHISMYICC